MQACPEHFLTTASEVHKYPKSLSPEMMNGIFHLHQNLYKLRSLNVFTTDSPRKKFVLNATVSRANKLWETLPSKVNDCPSLQLFKHNIGTWRCDSQCQFCSSYRVNAENFLLYCYFIVDTWQNCAVFKYQWPKYILQSKQ